MTKQKLKLKEMNKVETGLTILTPADIYQIAGAVSVFILGGIAAGVIAEGGIGVDRPLKTHHKNENLDKRKLESIGKVKEKTTVYHGSY